MEGTQHQAPHLVQGKLLSREECRNPWSSFVFLAGVYCWQEAAATVRHMWCAGATYCQWQLQHACMHTSICVATYWQVHRQQDAEFVEHLHALRVGHPVPAPKHIAWFEQNCGDLSAVPPGTPITELAPLNRVGAHRKAYAALVVCAMHVSIWCCAPQMVSGTDLSHMRCVLIPASLMRSLQVVDVMNRERFKALDTRIFTYRALDDFDVDQDFRSNIFNADERRCSAKVQGFTAETTDVGDQLPAAACFSRMVHSAVCGVDSVRIQGSMQGGA
jgi:hypothetical protein